MHLLLPLPEILHTFVQGNGVSVRIFDFAFYTELRNSETGDVLVLVGYMQLLLLDWLSY